MSANKMELIKELRARTNSSLIDCKKALEASNDDIEGAINWLRENGIVKAAKKAGRVAAEGAVVALGNEKRAVLVEINSETDFAAKNQKFVELLSKVAQRFLTSNAASLEEVYKLELESGVSIENALIEATSVIGEKISLRRVLALEANEDEVLGVYVHANSQVASVVKVAGKNVEAAKNVAMHVSAMNPEFSLVSQIPSERFEALKASFEKPAGFDSKPASIKEKIQEGWLAKQLSEFVLEKQAFVMEDSLSVEKYLANHGDKLVEVARFEVGEGIEKVQSNFAADVASMVAK